MCQPNLVSLLVVAATSTPVALGQLVAELPLDQFPTEDGWIYENSGCTPGPQSDVFFPLGDLMLMDTMGEGLCGYGGSRFEFDLEEYGQIRRGVIQLDLRARVLEHEGGNYFGFAIGAFLSEGRSVAIGIAPSLVQFQDFSVQGIDATQWHDYSLVWDVGAESYEVFVDGSLFAMLPQSSLEWQSVIHIGDSTGSSNARAEIASFTGTVSVPCNAADLARPFSVLDLADIGAFTSGFLGKDSVADLNTDGIFDLADINLFINAFVAGCP